MLMQHTEHTLPLSGTVFFIAVVVIIKGLEHAAVTECHYHKKYLPRQPAATAATNHCPHSRCGRHTQYCVERSRYFVNCRPALPQWPRRHPR